MYVHEHGIPHRNVQMSHAFFSSDATAGTNSAFVFQLLSCGPCWMTHPETSGADFLTLTEHRHRMAVEACGCGWEGRDKQEQMGCWRLPLLLEVFAEMTVSSLPGQLQMQTGLMGHQRTCPLLSPRVQVKEGNLCTPLKLSTWHPHPPPCRENFWKILTVRQKSIKVKNHYTKSLPQHTMAYMQKPPWNLTLHSLQLNFWVFETPFLQLGLASHPDSRDTFKLWICVYCVYLICIYRGWGSLCVCVCVCVCDCVFIYLLYWWDHQESLQAKMLHGCNIIYFVGSVQYMRQCAIQDEHFKWPTSVLGLCQICCVCAAVHGGNSRNA